MIFTPPSRWNQAAGVDASGPPSPPPPPSSCTPPSGTNDVGPVPEQPASIAQARVARTRPPPLPSPMDTARQAADAPARTQARDVAEHAWSVRWPMLSARVDVDLDTARVGVGPAPLLDDGWEL